VDGEKSVTLRGENIVLQFRVLVENYIERRFGKNAAQQN